MDNIIVRIVPLPRGAEGVTMLDADGDYNVYIDSGLTAEQQKAAYDHEARHIGKNHFRARRSVKECEAEASRK